VGAEYYGFVLALSVDYGLVNLSPYTESGEQLKNRVFKISAGYSFRL
jgi:hypothetical protein